MPETEFYPLRLQISAGRDYYCIKPVVTLGREIKCDLSFQNDRGISRQHAEIFFHQGSWYIRDAGSVNGTFVNGRRLAPGEKQLLDVGDRIRLAEGPALEVLPTPAGLMAEGPRPRRDLEQTGSLFPAGTFPVPREETAPWQPGSTECLPPEKEASACYGGAPRPVSPRQDPVVIYPDASVTIPPPPSAAQAQKNRCPACGSPVSGRFCLNCGSTVGMPEGTATIAPPAAAERRCPSCGAAVSGMFCTRCGNRVDRSGGTVPIAPAPAYRPSMPAPPPAPRPSAAPAPSQAPAAPKAKKPGLFGRLFGKKGQESAPAAPVSAPVPPPAPVPAAPQTDDIQFRGAAPQSINPGEYFTVKIMMYREDDHQRADREMAAIADEVKSASSSVYQAARGQEFRIALQSPEGLMDTQWETLFWNGVYAAADFEVYLPEDYDRRQLRLRGRVYSGDAVITDLKMILQVSSPVSQTVPCEKVQLRSAFISYASADRAKVVARLQGIMLACPDMDLFFDVESLRRGENWEPRLYREISQRDLFYLFWSHNAAASEWVQKELEYAVAKKTVDYIEPIPLEQPDVCPPPPSLMCKHFNDWTLRYLNNQ